MPKIPTGRARHFERVAHKRKHLQREPAEAKGRHVAVAAAVRANNERVQDELECAPGRMLPAAVMGKQAVPWTATCGRIGAASISMQGSRRGKRKRPACPNPGLAKLRSNSAIGGIAPGKPSDHPVGRACSLNAGGVHVPTPRPVPNQRKSPGRSSSGTFW